MHRETAVSTSVIPLAFLRYPFRKNMPCCLSRTIIIFLMIRSSGPNPVIWHIWMTADFLFIPVSRSSFSAANTASASLDTGSVISITVVASRRNFWSVLRFFSLGIRMDCHRKLYGTNPRHLRYGFPDTRHTARKI